MRFRRTVGAATLVGMGFGFLLPRAAQAATETAPAATARTAGQGTLHYTANESGDFASPHALGYNLHDTGSNRALIDSLPGNDRAVVWLGEKCPTGVSGALVNAVNDLAGDPKVFAYYLSDEPHAASCPGGAAALAQEADYIHAHAPGQLAFIVLLNKGSDYATFAPGNTHVDAVGIDPYPCNVNIGGCNVPHIDDHVNQAIAAGVPTSKMVPTFQLFGNSYYQMPDPSQLQSMLDEWAKVVPNPIFDYSYSWDCQSGSLSSCLSTNPGDQQVMAAHNGSSAPSPAAGAPTGAPPRTAPPVTTARRTTLATAAPTTAAPTTAAPTTAAPTTAAPTTAAPTTEASTTAPTSTAARPLPNPYRAHRAHRVRKHRSWHSNPKARMAALAIAVLLV